MRASGISRVEIGGSGFLTLSYLTNGQVHEEEVRYGSCRNGIERHCSCRGGDNVLGRDVSRSRFSSFYRGAYPDDCWSCRGRRFNDCFRRIEKSEKWSTPAATQVLFTRTPSSDAQPMTTPSFASELLVEIPPIRRANRQEYANQRGKESEHCT